MIGNYLTMVGLAFGAPKRTARQLLSHEPTPLDAISIAVAASALMMFGVGAIELSLDRTLADFMNDVLVFLRELQQAQVDGDAAEFPFSTEPAPPMAPLWSRTVFVVLPADLVFSVAGGAAAAAIGGALGGNGKTVALMTVFGAWLLLIRTPLLLIFYFIACMSPPETVFNLTLLLIVLSFYSTYVLAAFIAEAHGFKTAFGTFMALIAFGFFMSMFVTPGIAPP